MTCARWLATRIFAAGLLAIGAAFTASAQGLAPSHPLPPDESYEVLAAMRATGDSMPSGGVLISGGRELLVAVRQAGQADRSVLNFSIREAATGKELRRLRPRSAHLWRPRWDLSADGTVLAIATFEAERYDLTVIDVASDREIQRLAIPAGELSSVALSPDGRRVAGQVIHTDGRIHVWDIKSGAELRSFKFFADSMAFSPDGGRLLTALTDQKGLFLTSSDGIAVVWDLNTGQRLTELKLKDGGFAAAMFSPDGSRILTANLGDWESKLDVKSTATLWDAATGRPVMDIGRGEGPASTLSFSGDGSRIATVSPDRRVRIWDAKTGSLLARLGPHNAPRVPAGLRIAWGPASSGVVASFAREGASLVTSSYDGTVKVWADVAQRRAADLAAFTTSLAQAQAGDAAAMYRLVNAYRNGRGVAKNAELSSSWLARAADAGHAPANVELGQLLVSGAGERQDCIEGGTRLRKAASQGDAAAGTALDAVLSPLGGRQGASAMSPQIQADLLETQILDVLKRSEYPAFLANLCALEALGHTERLPAEAGRELVYHRAVGLRAAGKPRAALAALRQYLNEAGNAGANYTAAIRLLRPLQEEVK